MSKVTVVTDESGKIVVLGHAHAAPAAAGHPTGGVVAGPGQKLHHVDLPEDVSKIGTWEALHAKVLPHIR